MTYSNEFFTNRRALASKSAQKILELVIPLLSPNTVLDIGCATGVWLAEAKRLGAEKILGIDGPWVPMDDLEIAKEEFATHDLSQSLPTGLGFYDLIFCIEVAEHLSANTGAQLVRLITESSDAALFSAAVCGQGGTGHINEQPQSYWHKKFHDRGFVCFDGIRPLIWTNSEINVIYKQNMLLYVRKESCAYETLSAVNPSIPLIENEFDIDRIHPDLLVLKTRKKKRQKRKLTHKLKNIFS